MRSNYSAFQSPQFRVLSDSQVREIHAAACHILEYTGVVVHHEEAVEMLKKAGGYVSGGNRVRIPAGLVEWAIRQAPSRTVLYNRDGEPAMWCEGYNVYFGVGSDCPYLLDHNTGERRPFATQDVANGMTLCDFLPHIDFVMSMGIISDVPKEVTYQHEFAVMIKNTKKPMVITAADGECLNDIIDMAAAVVGGRQALSSRPLFCLYDEPSSPLQHSFTAIEKLFIMAENNLPVNYSPGAMAGATCPVTMAGAIAQAAAEILSGLVIHQLRKPGAPFVFGAGMSPIDMSSTQPTYSAPEAILAQAGLCDLAHHYNLPTWGFGGCSSSKVADQQASIEAATYNLMSAMMGCNIVHDVAYLEFGKTNSFEMLVINNEIIGQVKRIMGGITVDREHLALDAIHRVGPGGHFLGDEHTFKHFRENWQPKLTDRRTYEAWAEDGKKTMGDRAKEYVNFILENHRPQALPESVVCELDGILASVEKRYAQRG
ncbi:trimethylamine methyltransferase [Clostridiales bacterium PH28_bin88]|nr:trimethylamine methyltransferase [Clostridiales bacterium PH28_bin88]